MDNYQKSLVLARVLNTGVIMSIEKNEKELPALEKLIRQKTGTRYVSLVNSYTAAIHSALQGQKIEYGDRAIVNDASEQESKFLKWLNITPQVDSNQTDSYRKWSLQEFADHRQQAHQKHEIGILDFTPLGFGPAAAVFTNIETFWIRMERLKIFGSFDLRTMWTQEESAKTVQPTIQFNYRLLVAVLDSATFADIAELQKFVYCNVRIGVIGLVESRDTRELSSYMMPQSVCAVCRRILHFRF